MITLTSNEALRKHGILPPRESTPPSPSPPPPPTLDDILDDLTAEELRELGEDSHDDAAERYIAQFRAQRLAQERLEAQRSRFGSVIPIGRDDYTREVTEASKQDEPGDEESRGTGVVCFLYKGGYVLCSTTFAHIIHISYVIESHGATVRMPMCACWRHATRALNLSPSLATSVYLTYRIHVYPCSSCTGKGRSSLRSLPGDRIKSESLKVGSWLLQ